MPVRISVQICSHNRSHLSRRSIEALLAQDFPADQYEIVFVDDGSTDDTLEMAQNLALTSCCRVKVLTKMQGGLSRARNLGIRNCEGDVILFMDDDTIADAALLREHWAVHERNPRCVVLGWVNHVECLDSNEPRKYQMADYSRSFFWTSNVSVRRSFVEEVGLFDEEFQEYGWEDMELGYRLKKLGLERVTAEKAIVSHYKPPKQKKDVAGMLRQAESSGRSALIYIRKRPGIRSRMATGITWPRMMIDRLLRPFSSFFQSVIDKAPEGPMSGKTFFCARILASFRFFDAVRKGSTEKPQVLL